MTDLLSLWRASWQGGLVLLGIWIACRTLRNLPASVQCGLWRLGQVKLLIGLLPLAVALPLLAPAPAKPAAVQTDVADMRDGAPERATLHTPDGQVEAAPPAAAPEPTAVEAAPPTPAVPPISLPQAAALLYGLGIGSRLFLLWRGTQRVRCLRRGATPVVESEMTLLLSDLTRTLRLHRAPCVFLSNEVTCPLVTGVIRPVVILPRRLWQGASASERRLMLAHEMAHLKRGDLRWQLVGLAAQTLFFFHPLVWVAQREERITREIACDALTLHVTCETAARYGALLLHVATQKRALPLPSLCVGAVEKGTLMKRLNLLGQTAPARRLGVWGGIGLAAISVALLTPWRLTAQIPPAVVVVPPISQPTIADDADVETVTGTVLLPNGKPAANARVSWVAEQYPRPDRIVAEGQADEQGRFRLRVTNPPRPPGFGAWLTGDIVARAPGMAPGIGSIFTNDKPVHVRLHALARREAFFTDEAGRPIANLPVKVAALYYQNGTVHVDLPLTRTDSTGRVRVADLPRDGRIGWRILDTRWTPVALKQEFTIMTPPRQRYTLTPSRTLAGIVRYDDGRPLAGVWVYANQTDADWQSGVPVGRGAVTDSRGRYQITRLASGRYKLNTPTEGKGYVPTTARFVRVGSAPITEAAPLVVSEGAVVTGRVTRKPTGEPLGGAWVGGCPARNQKGNYSSYAVTDEDGRYRLRVPEGRTRVFLKANSHVGTQIKNPPAALLIVRAGQGNRQDFAVDGISTGFYTGVLVDQNGKPVANARIDMVGRDIQEPRTDRQGRYVIRTTWEAPRDYPIVVRRGNRVGKATLTPGRGRRVEVNLSSQPAATITGVVNGEHGKPLAGAKVWPMRQVGQSFSGDYIVETDSLGRYEFIAYPEYSYRVMAQSAGYGRVSIPDEDSPALSIVPGSAREMPPLRLPRANGWVEGRVVDQTGKPVAKAIVVIYGKSTVASGETDVDGRFKVGGVVATETLRASVGRKVSVGSSPIIASAPVIAGRADNVITVKSQR